MSSSNLACIQQVRTTNSLSTDSARSAVMVAATGLGKTLLMAGLAKTWPKGRIMMISHRFELNKQAQETLEIYCQEPVDFEQAGYEADQCTLVDRCRIVVASVQTLNAKRNNRMRLEKFDPNDFGLIMIDEAHRAVSPSYRRVIDYFLKNNRDCRLVGVTATPDRLDGVGLGHIFETVACDFNIRWGIDNGWLVPLRQKIVTVDDLDFSFVKSKTNELGEDDLNQRQLAELIENERVMHEMAAPIIEESGTKSCIVFCPSVSHARRLSEIINRHRPGSSIALDGSLPPMDPTRQRTLKGFKDGETQFLCNCGIATEGFDAPKAEIIAICRPTKSRALYTQMVGRGTRPLKGVVDGKSSVEDRIASISRSAKPYATVIDFVGQASRHNLVCTGDILAGENEPKEIVEIARRIVSNPNFDRDMVAAIRMATDEIEKQESARRAMVTAKVKYGVSELDIWSPMDWVPPRTVKQFRGSKPPSDKMRMALTKFGFTYQEVSELNWQQAKSMISKCVDRSAKGLCTIKQKRLLSRFGIDANRMTRNEASEQIDRIKQNGWQRPESSSCG
jgi:superfamily II DNA or RNA helicase